jgi:hypothetical protein
MMICKDRGRRNRRADLDSMDIRVTAERYSVIDSKHTELHDASDGAVQQLEDSTRRVQGGGQAAKQRWEDDGGPPIEMPLDTAGDLARKPEWSVLSLRDLNDAIRRERSTHDPVRLQQESERAERGRRRAIQVKDDKAAAAARAEHDRYRNAWEHT